MNAKRILAAGIVGTAVMTMLMLAAPMMGMPKMTIGEMLGGFLGIGAAAGWGMHFVIGVVLAAIYAAALAAHLPGPASLRGVVFGVGVFFVAQLVVTPMMGGGIFSGGNLLMIAGSLMGHLVYGGIVAAISGGAPSRQPVQGLGLRSGAAR